MLRRWLALMILAVMLVVSPSMAANYYVDLVAGDDGTGDGSTGSPYLTPDGAAVDNVITGGDEIRIKKSTITQLSGTCAFTNGSATITTSNDHSGTLADGTLLSKNSETPSGNEAWWSIASVSGTTVTMDKEYWGATDAAANCYYVVPTSTAYTNWDTQDPGTSIASRVKISGGWNLGNETREGYTAVVTTGNYGAIYQNNVDIYMEYAYFIGFFDNSSISYAAYYLDGHSSYYHHLYGIGFGNGQAFKFDAPYIIAENIYAGGGAHGIIVGDANDSSFKDIYVYTTSYTISGKCIFFGLSANTLVDNLNVYNCADFGVYIENSFNLFFKDVTIDTTGDDAFFTYNCVDNIYVNTLSASNITGYAVFRYADGRVYVNDITTASVTGDIFVYQSADIDGSVSRVFVTDGGVHTQYSSIGHTISSDTANARSGTAIKIEPSDSYGSASIKIGSTKVASTASDLTLQIYLKQDGSLGSTAVRLYAVQNGGPVSNFHEIQTVTTSYVQKTYVIDSSELTLNAYIDLYVTVVGTSGVLYVDDFSVSQ